MSGCRLLSCFPGSEGRNSLIGMLERGYLVGMLTRWTATSVEDASWYGVVIGTNAFVFLVNGGLAREKELKMYCIFTDP